MGRPKALVPGWLDHAVATLRDGGCGAITVVLGAAADESAALLSRVDPAADAVIADDWSEGMGASLRRGLAAIDATVADAVVVTLVDLPDVGADVVRRMLAGGLGTAALARASYAARPGHPVLIGRDHWAPIAAQVHGDVGARDYLASHEVRLVECGDLATGADVDLPPGRPTA